jgi:hypothetical protein
MAKLIPRSLVATFLLAGFISTVKADNPISNELQNKSAEPDTYRVESEYAAMRKAVEEARKSVSQFASCPLGEDGSATRASSEVSSPNSRGLFRSICVMIRLIPSGLARSPGRIQLMPSFEPISPTVGMYFGTRLAIIFAVRANASNSLSKKSCGT